MGQLDVYSLEDVSLITIMIGPISTYLAEEIEVNIESVVAYVYSSNMGILSTKKRKHLALISRPAGDFGGAIYMSWIFIPLNVQRFLPISKDIDKRVM